MAKKIGQDPTQGAQDPTQVVNPAPKPEGVPVNQAFDMGDAGAQPAQTQQLQTAPLQTAPAAQPAAGQVIQQAFDTPGAAPAITAQPIVMDTVYKLDPITKYEVLKVLNEVLFDRSELECTLDFYQKQLTPGTPEYQELQQGIASYATPEQQKAQLDSINKMVEILNAQKGSGDGLEGLISEKICLVSGDAGFVGTKKNKDFTKGQEVTDVELKIPYDNKIKLKAEVAMGIVYMVKVGKHYEMREAIGTGIAVESDEDDEEYRISFKPTKKGIIAGEDGVRPLVLYMIKK